MDPWAALLILLALSLLGVLAWRFRTGAPRFPARNPEKRLEQKLLSMTLGNRGAIERGVTAKRRLHPQASRAELLEMLHEDYVRDRSR